MSRSARWIRAGRSLLAAAATAALGAALAGAVQHDGKTKGENVWLNSQGAWHQGAPSSSSGSGGREERWIRAPRCVSGIYRYDYGPECQSAANEIVEYCSDGSRALDPWWRSYRNTDGTWSNWQVMSGYQCTVDTIADLVAREFAVMPIASNAISVQPPHGWTITNLPTIVYVDRAPRTMDVVLLGHDVTIRALPRSYTWTWGDGSSTTTSSPGAPYPNQSVTHTYTDEERDVTIRLTTTWTGSFTLNGGGTWIDAPGTATTVSAPVDLHIYNPHSHQVDCDLYTTCDHP